MDNVDKTLKLNSYVNSLHKRVDVFARELDSCLLFQANPLYYMITFQQFMEDTCDNIINDIFPEHKDVSLVIFEGGD